MFGVDVTEIGSLALTDRALPAGLRHDHAGAEDNAMRHQPALAIDALNTEIGAAYRGIREEVATYRYGHVTFSGARFFGSEMLALGGMPERAICGDGVGWPSSYLDLYLPDRGGVKQSPLSWSFEPGAAEEIAEPCLLLGGPGSHVHGHWLLDFIPALYWFRTREDLSKFKILTSTLHDWVLRFLDILDVPRSQLRQVSLKETLRPRHAVKPDLPKIGAGVFVPIVSAGLEDLRARCLMRQRMSGEIVARPARIYLSRAKWGSRVGAAMQDIENMFWALGYSVIHPEEHPVERLAAIMSEARIVVGEEGGALHNAIFAPAGCLVAMVETRNVRNLWHLGFAECFRQTCFYLPQSALADPVGAVAAIRKAAGEI